MTDLKNLTSVNFAESYHKSFDCSPDEPFQKVLEDLYSYIDPTTRFMHRARINLFMELMKELIKNGTVGKFENAIDIGSNSGIYSKLISDFGFKNVRGIDIDKPLLDLANKYLALKSENKNIVFEYFNAENLTETGVYDFLLCTEVIEHTTHPEKVITNIKRILKPGGVAIITLPNAMSYPFFLTWLSHKIKGKPIDGELRDHLSYPSYRSLELFKDPGLKRIKISGTNLYHWYFLNRIPGFPFLNRMNFFFSKLFPLKYFTQFFFMVYKKK